MPTASAKPALYSSNNIIYQGNKSQAFGYVIPFFQTSYTRMFDPELNHVILTCDQCLQLDFSVHFDCVLSKANHASESKCTSCTSVGSCVRDPYLGGLLSKQYYLVFCIGSFCCVFLETLTMSLLLVGWLCFCKLISYSFVWLLTHLLNLAFCLLDDRIVMLFAGTPFMCVNNHKLYYTSLYKISVSEMYLLLVQ